MVRFFDQPCICHAASLVVSDAVFSTPVLTYVTSPSQARPLVASSTTATPDGTRRVPASLLMLISDARSCIHPTCSSCLHRFVPNTIYSRARRPTVRRQSPGCRTFTPHPLDVSSLRYFFPRCHYIKVKKNCYPIPNPNPKLTSLASFYF